MRDLRESMQRKQSHAFSSRCSRRLAAPSIAWQPVMVGILCFAVYASSMYQSIPGGDAGELLAEACQLGTAHPPGYPLFTMLNHAVYRAAPLLRTMAPHLSTSQSTGGVTSAPVAWGANLLACMQSACTAAMLVASVNTITAETRGHVSTAASRAAAIAGALCFAFAPLTWEYAVGAEVFALNK